MGSIISHTRNHRMANCGNGRTGARTYAVALRGRQVFGAIVAFAVALACAVAMPSSARADAGSTAASDTSTPVYRMYNAHSGEHFYTADRNEAIALSKASWWPEQVSWYASADGDPVYRLYNPNGGHFYTMNGSERDALVAVGWVDEGVAWHVPSGGVPIYREYNPNSSIAAHNYTADSNEDHALANASWNSEGVAWYAVSGMDSSNDAVAFLFDFSISNRSAFCADGYFHMYGECDAGLRYEDDNGSGFTRTYGPSEVGHNDKGYPFLKAAHPDWHDWTGQLIWD